MSDRLGFNTELEMEHLKKIVNKDDSITLSSRFTKYLIEQAEQMENLKNAFDDLDSDYIDLVKQNKRYHEVREIIDQVYKDNYVRNAYGYEDGYLDGLDTAMNIIDEALESESDE